MVFEAYNVKYSVLCVQLFGGDTEISVSLCGFNDTNRRGWHVHTVGSTDDRCAAAGSHFNPQQLNHGAPDDSERYVVSLVITRTVYYIDINVMDICNIYK